MLSGGTGTPKLLQGLVQVVGQEKLSVIANTGEDLEVSGLYVAPDLDSVVYTLANVIDERTWYGIHENTFSCYEMLKRLGQEELLRLGDRDRAVHLYRTVSLKRGKTLSKVTDSLCERFGVRARVMPMSNERVRTRVHTESGEMSFNEFWVARRARDRVINVTFDGAEKAKAAPGVLEALEDSDAIIIGPSNPVTSMGPILAIEEIEAVLSENRVKVMAVSPIVGNAPVSGPAGVLMRGLGYEVSPKGVAQIYRGVASTLVIHESDGIFVREIEGFGMRVALADLLMPDRAARVRLARTILGLIKLRPNEISKIRIRF